MAKIVKSTDPFADVTPQLEDLRRYRGYVLLPLMAFAMIVWGFYLIFVHRGFLVGFILLGVSLAILWSQVREVNISAHSIEATNWFGQNQHLDWGEIQTLQLILTRNYYCLIWGEAKKITLMYAWLQGAKDMEMLIKTVIERAGLHHISGESKKKALYEKQV